MMQSWQHLSYNQVRDSEPEPPGKAVLERFNLNTQLNPLTSAQAVLCFPHRNCRRGLAQALADDIVLLFSFPAVTTQVCA